MESVSYAACTDTVEQHAYRCPQDGKRALLVHIVRSRGLRQVLCFVRTKHGASRLARQLERDGLETSAIHGDKTQGARLDALAAFKEGKLEVLVATDVAARGLDVDDLPLVVNYELPHVPEDYIHRIGRTGRAGATGEAISFVAPEEEKYLSEIERLLKRKIEVRTLDGFDPAAAPRERKPEARPSRAAKTTARERPPERDQAPTRHRRQEEREEAYARNPDQVLPASTTASHANAKSVLVHGHHAKSAAKARPVPALLMKRKAPQTENA